MVREVFTVLPDETILECSRKMAQNKISSLIIKRAGEVIGIITEQDISRKVHTRGLLSNEVMVYQVMSRNIVSINSGDDITDAATLMGENGVKHLPVINGKDLVGIITFKDLIDLDPNLVKKFKFNSNQRRESTVTING